MNAREAHGGKGDAVWFWKRCKGSDVAFGVGHINPLRMQEMGVRVAMVGTPRGLVYDKATSKQSC